MTNFDQRKFKAELAKRLAKNQMTKFDHYASQVKQDSTVTEIAEVGRLGFECDMKRDEIKIKLYRLWYMFDHLFVFVDLALAAYDFQRDTQVIWRQK